jgi:hypothetical protein
MKSGKWFCHRLQDSPLELGRAGYFWQPLKSPLQLFEQTEDAGRLLNRDMAFSN